MAATALKTFALAVAGMALIGFLAYASARSTLYVVTTKRLVLKVGVALPIFINVPFTKITSAAVRVYGDGTGDVPVSLAPSERVAYFALWPHARPFHFARPEPALRCVPDAAHVDDIVGHALAAAAGETALAAGGAAVAEAREVISVASGHATA